MNSSQNIQELEQKFAGYNELKAITSRFIENKLTWEALKAKAKNISDIQDVASSLKLTDIQKLQLKTLFFPQQTPQLEESKEISNVNSPNVKIPEAAIPKTTKPKKLPKVVINTTRSRGELKLLERIIEKNKAFGWKKAIGSNGGGDVMWSGLDIPWEDTYLAKEIRLNRIPGMKMLAHKKMTGFYLNKFREFYPEEFDFYPKTFLLPEEYDQFKEYKSKHPDRLFIAKPTSGSQGDGIILVRKASDLAPSSTITNEMVVQEYIDKPLLLDDKKFDLRLYVLISNVKPVIAFLNEEGLARFCTEAYQAPTQENLKNAYMHLTNYSLNKLSQNYKYTEECVEINDGSKRTFTSFWKSIEKAGYSKDEILTNIKSLVQKLVFALEPVIQFNYNVAFEGKDDGMCFHVLGVDVLIDQDLKPWLLEINANPSLNIGHEDSMDPKAKEIISPVDQFVKEKVIEDSILITRKSVAKQLNTESYRTFTKVYDTQTVDEFDEMNLFKDILYIFEKLSGVRFKTHLTSSKFVKLAAIRGMTNEHVVKANYDIIYQKAIKLSDDNQMNFPSFIKAIEDITILLNKGTYTFENKKELIENTIQLIRAGL